MIGIDIVEIKRIEKLRNKYEDKFLRRVFSIGEIELYKKHKRRVSFLAGRFAAKEAVIKALGRYIPWNRIEVLGEGKPYVEVDGIESTLHVSISHTKDFAVAIAIISDCTLTTPACR
ncbi:holo-[acyl-carrier-protein] synthase [candidate division WOR-3 bacterium JGI_Cruoil_03_44_89]|uniref:Holo-[acyl-carrier-protein] synthase n=1 Tax=candidate division WOR-3 bacterium JGI_Cruoil_03_44_89 TaxID=1973748 RepID=A0A235BUD7_UNCW3|nr:MAG: holo-[acyl-carrier-protein] synthase [candidate division WOR-3 bacterium JGI_Cruoil_03_44_89]